MTLKPVLDSLQKLYARDLQKLEDEIRQYESESLIWKTSGDIKNSAGNLCLHLCGNLQHYIGRVLGGSDYVRNRDNEFALKNIPRAELFVLIQTTKDKVVRTLPMLTDEQLLSEYPEKVFDYSMTSLHFLLHLEAHLNYHLGQVNYHRRMIS